MLNTTKVELELIQMLSYIYSLKKVWDSKFLIIPRDIAKQTKKYLKSYTPKQESKHNIYLDAYNLYCYAMSKFLPTCG